MTIRRALVCAPRMPEYDREGGSRRVFHLIEFLRQAGWAVTFIADDATGGERYAGVLRQLGAAVYAGPRSCMAGDDYLPNPEALIAASHFDIAILVFWNVGEAYMPIIRSLTARTRIIVDSIDLHFVRNARSIFRAAESTESHGVLDGDYAQQMSRELNTYAAADAVLAVSQKEADLINDLTANPALATSIPLMEDLPPSDLTFADRQGFVFIGNYRHPPNRDAIVYLCHKVLPHIERSILDQHPIYLVGNEIEKVRPLIHDHARHVKVVGWVPSLLPYLQRARATIVPILSGAGTKTKLIQSLTVGTPAVSTTVGVEGLDLEHERHVLIADGPEDFASALARLAQDAELWQKLASQGHEHISAVHGREAVQRKFLCVVSALLESTTSA